jgi:hypothetical protein
MPYRDPVTKRFARAPAPAPIPFEEPSVGGPSGPAIAIGVIIVAVLVFFVTRAWMS